MRGRLRVDAPTIIGRFLLAPAIPRFLSDHPELAIDLTLRDHVVDPIGEGLDVVLRMAAPRESELVQKRLGAMKFHIVASPDYLAKRGRPRVPADIQKHEIMGFIGGSRPLPWRFYTGEREVRFQPHVRDDIARGALEVVLRDHEHTPVPIHALFTRENSTRPKVRVFLDFVTRLLSAPRRRSPSG